MEPVLAICALTLLTWGVAIWATYESDQQESEPEQAEEKEKRASGDIRDAA